MENVLKSGKTTTDQSALEVALLDWCRKTVHGYLLVFKTFFVTLCAIMLKIIIIVLRIMSNTLVPVVFLE